METKLAALACSEAHRGMKLSDENRFLLIVMSNLKSFGDTQIVLCFRLIILLATAHKWCATFDCIISVYVTLLPFSYVLASVGRNSKVKWIILYIQSLYLHLHKLYRTVNKLAKDESTLDNTQSIVL